MSTDDSSEPIYITKDIARLCVSTLNAYVEHGLENDFVDTALELLKIYTTGKKLKADTVVYNKARMEKK